MTQGNGRILVMPADPDDPEFAAGGTIDSGALYHRVCAGQRAGLEVLVLLSRNRHEEWLAVLVDTERPDYCLGLGR